MVSSPAKGGKCPVANPQKSSMLCLNQYIPPEYLGNLRKHKYSGCDRSIVSRYLMQSYWNFVVGLIPMTVASNMITFIGFIVGLSSSIPVLYYYYIQNAVYPSWVWYYAAASVFFYQTMDAIDGKQARRTGTSSPLGELFDHGCDAFLIPPLQMNVVLMANMPPWMTFSYFLLSSLALFASIWEQYSTGTLDLGYFSAPTEGILLSCVLFVLTGRYSTSLYDKTLIGPYSIHIPDRLTTLFSKDLVVLQIGSVRSIGFLFFCFTSVFTILTNIAHVINTPTVQKSKLTCFLIPLPVVVLAVLHILLYGVYSDVHDAFPLAFELSFAFLISFMSTRLTLSRLCGMPYSYLNLLFILTFVITGTSVVTHFYPLSLSKHSNVKRLLGISMMFLTFFGVFQYMHMIVSVFRQIASFLNINILFITPKRQD
ncbi:unnamed protein product [Phytomonas sp. EM1]|nr:unnamed protein product [Phytomonas sp. EM1]|eukprot:CCW63283.1 unnamed protein product [Phytomonas sp. isolate EM1]